MSALTDALSRPNSKKVFLAEITAGKNHPVWDNTWNPYMHSGLVLSAWASDISGKGDGEEITHIKDKVQGTTYAVRNTDIARPYYVKEDTTINGRPCIKLTTGNQFLSLQPVNMGMYYSEDQFTWIGLVKKPVGQTTPTFIASGSASYFLINDVNQNNFIITHNEFWAPDTSGNDDGEWHVWRAVRDGDDFSLYMDGVLTDSTTITDAEHFNTSVELYMSILGAGMLTGNNPVYFAGIFMFKTALSTGDAEAFEAGLNNYYGLNDDGPTAELLYTVNETERVVGVSINGVNLTEAASVIACAATLETYYWDGKRIYINSNTDPRVMTNTTMVMIQYNYATRDKNLNGVYYEGRIASIPSVTMKIEDKFNGIGQVGTGVVSLTNDDNHFNDKRNYHWEAGKTVLKIGCDYRDADMEYADYGTIGTWNNDFGKIGMDTFDLNLVEVKDRVKKQIPTSSYTREEYPRIDESAIGRPKQIGYGKVYGASPVCIDIDMDQVGLEGEEVYRAKFKIAGHAIKSIDAVRVACLNGWIGIDIEDIDLEEATFVYDGWDGTSELSVDFQGRKNDDGTLMENASDQVKDILATILETDIDATSFADAKTLLDRGNYYSETRRITTLKPGIYITEYTDAYTVISEMNAYVGAYLYTNELGKYVYKVFEPEPGEGKLTVQEGDFKKDNFGVEIPTKGVVSLVHSKYAKRLCEEWGVDRIDERNRNQYLRNEKMKIIVYPEPKLWEGDDCGIYNQRRLIYEGELPQFYTFDLMIGEAFFLKPGDFIHLQFVEIETGGYVHDVILEIYQIKFSYFPDSKVSIVAGNMHGFSGMVGFYVSDEEVLPARFASLPGYGDGSITWKKAWHRLIKDYARQNYAYYVNDYGFADPSDPESFIPGALF